LCHSFTPASPILLLSFHLRPSCCFAQQGLRGGDHLDIALSSGKEESAKEASNLQSFLLNDVELHFSADEVAADFCDAASPLSLAGYMNGEFVRV